MGFIIMSDGKPVKVFRKEFNGRPSYSIALSKKEGDNWIRIFKPIRFMPGYAVSDGQYIYIKEAFPAVDSWVKDGQQYTREVWVIKEFVSDAPYTTPEIMGVQAEPVDVEGFSQVEDDVPF